MLKWNVLWPTKACLCLDKRHQKNMNENWLLSYWIFCFDSLDFFKLLHYVIGSRQSRFDAIDQPEIMPILDVTKPINFKHVCLYLAHSIKGNHLRFRTRLPFIQLNTIQLQWPQNFKQFRSTHKNVNDIQRSYLMWFVWCWWWWCCYCHHLQFEMNARWIGHFYKTIYSEWIWDKTKCKQ